MKKPTTKQRKLAKLLAENLNSPKKKPIGQLVRESGYSIAVSRNPGAVLANQSFQCLLNEVGIGPTKVAELWKQLLETPAKDSSMSFSDKIKTAKELSKIYNAYPDQGEGILAKGKQKFFKAVEALQMSPEEEKEEQRKIEEAEIREREAGK